MMKKSNLLSLAKKKGSGTGGISFKGLGFKEEKLDTNPIKIEIKPITQSLTIKPISKSESIPTNVTKESSKLSDQSLLNDSKLSSFFNLEQEESSPIESLNFNHFYLIQEALENSLYKNQITLFNFNTNSPDDTVLLAQGKSWDDL